MSLAGWMVVRLIGATLRYRVEGWERVRQFKERKEPFIGSFWHNQLFCAVHFWRFQNIADVTVHIDPEDDEHAAPGKHLGLRDEVLGRLQACWEHLPAARQIRRVNLHYLNGQIQVEVELPLALGADPQQAVANADAFSEAATADSEIAGVRVLYS